MLKKIQNTTNNICFQKTLWIRKVYYVHVQDNEIKKEKQCEKSLHIPPNIDYDNMDMRCLHNFNNYIQNNNFNLQTCCVWLLGLFYHAFTLKNQWKIIHSHQHYGHK
jgi:hypothetical protein